MKFGIRELVFLLVLLAMPLAAYFFVFEPRNKQIAEAEREILDKQRKLRTLEQATMNIADLTAEIDRLEDAIDLFKQKLPEEREVEVILRQVWELAALQRLTPKTVRTDRPVTSTAYSELPIRMTITGDFDGFYSFMLALEKLNRITRVPSMKLKKLNLDEAQMQADIVLSIFYEQAGNAASTGTDSGRNRL